MSGPSTPSSFFGGRKIFSPGDVVRTRGSAINLNVFAVRSTHGDRQEFTTVGSHVWHRSDDYDLVTPGHRGMIEPDDLVDHPQHYKSASGIECIDVAETMNFNRGNALKYIWRAGEKGGQEKEVEDLRKAAWYIQREIERLTIERAKGADR